MQEIWKDIRGYEGLYAISNMGKVKSFRPSNKHFGTSEHLLKPTIANNGYEQVTLYLGPNKRKKCQVHKLVAEAFIANPDNLPCVNHKDENPLNNQVDNLEWCTYSYNNAYGTARIRMAITTGSKISQYTLEGIHLATYNSLSIASDITRIPKHVINDCCSGHTQCGAGYYWKRES